MSDTSPAPAEKPGKIIPPEAAPLRNLTVTMAVMCYLACLAIGALILIDRAVDGWTRGLSREITVQIRETRGTDIAQKLDQAKAILDKANGIVSSEILPREAGIKLLEPWLGQSGFEDLPVPRLIRVIVDENHMPDFASLEATLKSSVDGASLDTHRRWAAELTRMATTLSTVSWLILMLICASAIAMVIFATNAVLDANRSTVDVLHLVGARDGYIARQIDRRFLATGLWAGCIGVALAAATFLLVSLSGEPTTNALAAASRSLLFAPDGTALTTYLALLTVPPVATIIALITSRITLMRMLGKVQ